MKLRGFLEELNQLTVEKPESLDWTVIYSSDDEGNNYQKVNWTATPMEVEDANAYQMEQMWDETGEHLGTNYNTVCVN